MLRHQWRVRPVKVVEWSITTFAFLVPRRNGTPLF